MGSKSRSSRSGTTWGGTSNSNKKPQQKGKGSGGNVNKAKCATRAAQSGMDHVNRSDGVPDGETAPLEATDRATAPCHQSHSRSPPHVSLASLPRTGTGLIGKVVVFKNNPLAHGNPRIHPPSKPTLNLRKVYLFDSPAVYADHMHVDPTFVGPDDSAVLVTADDLKRLAIGREASHYGWHDHGYFEHKYRVRSPTECVLQDNDVIHVRSRTCVLGLHSAQHVLTLLAAMFCTPGGERYERAKRGKAFGGMVNRVLKLGAEFMVKAHVIDKPNQPRSLMRDPARTLVLPVTTSFEAALASASGDELVLDLTEPYLASSATVIFASVLGHNEVPRPVVIGSTIQFSVHAPPHVGMASNEFGAMVELDDRQAVLDLVALAEHLRAKANRTHLGATIAWNGGCDDDADGATSFESVSAAAG